MSCFTRSQATLEAPLLAQGEFRATRKCQAEAASEHGEKGRLSIWRQELLLHSVFRELGSKTGTTMIIIKIKTKYY